MLHISPSVGSSLATLFLLLALLLSTVNGDDTTESPSVDFKISTITSLADLPPLPRRVLKWSPFDVERWLNVTVGYPELSFIVRKYLIDGPTLVNMNNIEQVFSPTTIAPVRSGGSSSSSSDKPLHPAQVAKLKAHQKMLRGQCACEGDFASSSSSTSRYDNLNFWTYLDYSSVSTTFHVTAAALAPRFGLISAYLFDRPLLCCALATPTGTDLEMAAAESVMSAGDVEISTSSTSSSPSLYASPCGHSASLCAATPSILTTVVTILFPWTVMIWHGLLRSFSPHPFITIVWFLACLTLQVSEVFTVYRIAQMVKSGEVQLTEVLKEELFWGYLHWLFWGPTAAALVVGYFFPHWCSYMILLALTVLAGVNVVTFVLNVVGSLGFGSGNSADENGERQQQRQQQHGASSPTSNAQGQNRSSASSMD